MLTEDYLMRMINQALSVLMTAIGLKKAGKYSEALQAIEQAIEQLTTLPASLIDQMDDASIISMLTSQGQLDAGRLAVLADLYQEAGEVLSSLDRPAQVRFSLTRSLHFHLEFVLAEADNFTQDHIEKIESLYKGLKDQALPVETLMALSDYYQRLLSFDEHSLQKMGISRTSVEETLAKLDQQISSN